MFQSCPLLETSVAIASRTMKLAAGGEAAEREARRMVAEKIEAALSLQTLAFSGGLGTTPQGAARKSSRITGAGPRWSIISRVLGLLAASWTAWSRRPVHATLTGSACCAAAARTRLMAGSAGSVETLSLRKIRTPTVPLVVRQLQISRDCTPEGFCFWRSGIC
jgi:hypothetical protein